MKHPESFSEIMMRSRITPRMVNLTERQDLPAVAELGEAAHSDMGHFDEPPTSAHRARLLSDPVPVGQNLRWYDIAAGLALQPGAFEVSAAGYHFEVSWYCIRSES